MSKPIDPSSGPRLRARARTGSSAIRPEVSDALGGLERSLADVAKWEQLLAGKADPPTALPEGYVGLSPESLEPKPEPEPAPAHMASETVAVAPVPIEAEPKAAPATIVAKAAGHPSPEEVEDALAPPLLTEFSSDAEAAEPAEPDGSVLWSARTVPPPPPAAVAADAAEDAIAARRRNARILSWAGAIVAVAALALWLVPDRSSDDNNELPAIKITTTTASDTQILDVLSTTTVAPAVTTPVTTAPATPTTKKTTATTKKATTPTTARATTPTTTQSTPYTTTVQPIRTLPGEPATTAPPPTTAPPTTTTLPPQI